MKKFSFGKKQIIKALTVLLVTITLFNGFLPLINPSSPIENDQNYFQLVLNQPISFFTENSCNKLNSKPLSQSFIDNFYSNDYFINKLSNYSKKFIIISETFSEQNIRSSTFLIAQTTTST